MSRPRVEARQPASRGSRRLGAAAVSEQPGSRPLPGRRPAEARPRLARGVVPTAGVRAEGPGPGPPRPRLGSEGRARAGQRPPTPPGREGPGAGAARLPPPPDDWNPPRGRGPHACPAALARPRTVHAARPGPPSPAASSPRGRLSLCSAAPARPVPRAGLASRARARARRRRLRLLLSGGRRKLSGVGPPPGRKRPPRHRLPGAAIPLLRPPPPPSPSGSAFLPGRVSRARWGRGMNRAGAVRDRGREGGPRDKGTAGSGDRLRRGLRGASVSFAAGRGRVCAALRAVISSREGIPEPPSWPVLGAASPKPHVCPARGPSGWPRTARF